MSTYTKRSESTDPIQIVSYEQPEEDSFESPIAVVENDNVSSYARDLAFMAEPVEIMILPSHDKNDTTRLVSVSVNGKSYYMLRGEWQTVPRFVLEVIVRAKRETWNFGYRKAADGSTFETSNAYNVLRYPHHFRDANPKGQAWYDSIKDQVS
jgi:hypothetical protein